jgi:Cu/Zn superoxide dismutase
MSSQLRNPRVLVAAAGAAALLALGLAFAVATGADARGQATTIGLIASMNASSEVPAPSGNVSGALGTFTGTATKSDTGAALQWQMTFSGLTGPATAAHIHVAARGQPGPVVVPLCGPCTSPASGTANVDAAVLAALQTGGAYANVHTDTNRAGEVRGQIGVAAPVRTTLNARQEVPKPKGSVARATGSFVATVATEGATGTVTWRLTFARLTGRAVAAHIHIARRGRPGPVAVALCGPCRSGARGNATLPAAALAAIEAGRAYVNVHTARNAAGEIRGQLPAAPLRITT